MIFYGVPDSPEYWEWRRGVDEYFAQIRAQTAIENHREHERVERRRRIGAMVFVIGLPIVVALALASIM